MNLSTGKHAFQSTYLVSYVTWTQKDKQEILIIYSEIIAS